MLQFEQVTAHDGSPAANYSSIRPTTQWFLPLLLRVLVGLHFHFHASIFAAIPPNRLQNGHTLVSRHNTEQWQGCRLHILPRSFARLESSLARLEPFPFAVPRWSSSVSAQYPDDVHG